MRLVIAASGRSRKCRRRTHLHLVVTDEQGVLPSFHRIVALGTKVLRAWEGPVWDHEPTSVVRLTTREAVVQKIAYTLANPVAAGLIRHASEWPGAKVLAFSGSPQARAAMGSALLRSPSASSPWAYIAKDSRLRLSRRQVPICAKYASSRATAASSNSQLMPVDRTRGNHGPSLRQ
jgi:hypothetical protein